MNAIPSTPPAAATYDQVPYESVPFGFSQPARIGAIASLLGLEVASPETCRVLEIGCGMGDNLLPLARRFPKAQFVGIDPAGVQIERARQLAKAMELENVSLRRVGVADVDASYGMFDYVICHGVFSWVDEATRRTILRVCGERLDPKGIALISYNTLPGWHQAKALRDMMLFHTAGLADPSERVNQAKSLIRFLIEGMPGASAAYREFLNAELKMIESLHPSYVLHDHLGATNHPMYFHEVASQARQNGLGYVADAHPEIAYLGSFPERIQKTLLSGIDLIQVEQYVDYLTNRRFRTSLFCKNSRFVNRALRSEQIFSFNIESRFPPVDPESIDLQNYTPREFATDFGVSVNAGTPHCAALMLVLSNLRGRSIRALELLDQALDLLQHEPSRIEAEVICRRTLHEIGIELVMRGGLRISLAPTKLDDQPPAKPKSLAPAAAISAMGRKSFWTTQHASIDLDTVDAALLAWCDGTRDEDALVEALKGAIAAGTIVLNSSDPSRDPDADIDAPLREWLRARLAGFARSGLLFG